MKYKYRIVTDRWQGYEAQYKRWWWPFWAQCNGTNTRSTLDLARLVCSEHNRRQGFIAQVIDNDPLGVETGYGHDK